VPGEEAAINGRRRGSEGSNHQTKGETACSPAEPCLRESRVIGPAPPAVGRYPMIEFARPGKTRCLEILADYYELNKPLGAQQLLGDDTGA
jgi:hypothetical protein